MKFIPLGDRVLIKPDGVMTETASGMIIPPTSQGEVKTGVVMAVGPKVAGVVKEGDRVIYSPHSISEAEVDGVKVIYLREGDCHFIISPEERERAGVSKFHYGDKVVIVSVPKFDSNYPVGKTGRIYKHKSTLNNSPDFADIEIEDDGNPKVCYVNIENPDHLYFADRMLELVNDQK